MSFSLPIRSLIHSSKQFLTQPLIKESVKNVASYAPLIFGLIEIYDLFRKPTNVMPRRSVVRRSGILKSAKTSILLTAASSLPIQYVVNFFANKLFSERQLNRFFGPNASFAVNPWHPRHVVSLVTIAFAMPGLILSLVKTLKVAARKMGLMKAKPNKYIDIDPPYYSWMDKATHRKNRSYVLWFNTLTSHPILHLANQFILK